MSELGEIRVRIEPALDRLVRAALLWAEPVAVGPAGAALQAEMDRTAGDLAARWAGHAPGEIPGLAPARELYRAFGIDPTRTRPSSEALLRRVIAGKGLPRILNAVDVCNLCSVRSLLPIGLYDTGRIQGEAVLRRGRPGESYPGIRKDDVHVGGRPVMADDAGPFGNPTSDSLRTSVTAETRSLLMVLFAPASFEPRRLEQHAAAGCDLMALHLVGPAGPVRTSFRLLE